MLVHSINKKDKDLDRITRQIHTLQCRAFQKHLAGELPDLEDVNHFIRRGNTQTLILKKGRKIIGYLSGRRDDLRHYEFFRKYDPKIKKFNQCYHLSAVAIEEQYQGNGYTLVLFQKMIADLKKNGVKKLSFYIRTKRGRFDQLIQEFVKKIHCYHVVDNWEETGEQFQFVMLEI